MRLFEIETGGNAPVYATERFKKTLRGYTKGYGDKVEKVVMDFIDHKRSHPNIPFSSKDAPFTGNPSLRGIMHVHIVHGKVILVYDVSKSGLLLYTLSEHSEFDTAKACVALADFCKAAKLSAFEPPAQKAEIKVTAEQREEMVQLLYAMAIEMPEAMRLALNDEWSDTIYMLRAVADVDEDAIFQTFGGKQKLASDISTILKNMGVKLAA